jgi:hypothetical protein
MFIAGLGVNFEFDFKKVIALSALTQLVLIIVPCELRSSIFRPAAEGDELCYAIRFTPLSLRPVLPDTAMACLGSLLCDRLRDALGQKLRLGRGSKFSFRRISGETKTFRAGFVLDRSVFCSSGWTFKNVCILFCFCEARS